MIRLAYLDEDKGNRNTFHRVFKNDFEIVMLDDNSKVATVDMVIDEIENQHIDVLAVDFRLADSGWVPYNGDEVVRKIWEKRRFFPVFMLTSYVNNALQKMDNVFLINDKDWLADDKKVEMLKKQITSATETYHRIVNEKTERVKELVQKRKEGSLDETEEIELLRLNIDMYAIDPESNPISPDLMQTQSVNDLHEMVDLAKALLKSIKD